jgi:hypothetical protein
MDNRKIQNKQETLKWTEAEDAKLDVAKNTEDHDRTLQGTTLCPGKRAPRQFIGPDRSRDGNWMMIVGTTFCCA